MLNKLLLLLFLGSLFLAGCSLEPAASVVANEVQDLSQINQEDLSRHYKIPGFSMKIKSGKLVCTNDAWLPIGTQYNLRAEVRWGNTVTFLKSFTNDCQGDYYVNSSFCYFLLPQV